MPDSESTTEETAPAPSSAPIVGDWFVQWFHGADLPTHLFNRFQDAKQDLIRRLDAAHKE
jgi:hypothetical protein